MQTSQADEAARPISTESPIENESSTVNRDNNTGKPRGILISTENERPSDFPAAGTGETGPSQSPTWAALLTQSVSILSGGDGEGHVSSDLLVPHDFSTRGSSPRG
jgi:hypothetical protein